MMNLSLRDAHGPKVHGRSRSKHFFYQGKRLWNKNDKCHVKRECSRRRSWVSSSESTKVDIEGKRRGNLWEPRKRLRLETRDIYESQYQAAGLPFRRCRHGAQWIPFFSSAIWAEDWKSEMSASWRLIVWWWQQMSPYNNKERYEWEACEKQK